MTDVCAIQDIVALLWEPSLGGLYCAAEGVMYRDDQAFYVRCNKMKTVIQAISFIYQIFPSLSHLSLIEHSAY